MSDEPVKCELCGEPMPAGEQMFKIHGWSGPCPKPPLPKEPDAVPSAEIARLRAAVARMRFACLKICEAFDRGTWDDGRPTVNTMSEITKAVNVCRDTAALADTADKSKE